jgi:DNA repair protein SbcD/Mre11
VEIRLEGRVGFDRSELDVKKLQQDLQQLSQALIMLVKYNVESVEYATPLLEGADRLQVEHEVFMDLLMAHHHYKGRSQALAQGLIDLKSRQMEGQSEPELYAFVQTLLGQS